MNLSASQATAYKRCPQAWAYRYLDGIKVAPSWALKGRGQHKALEHNFSQKVESRADLKLGDVLDVYRTEIDHVFRHPTEEIQLDDDESQGTIVDTGVVGLTAYHEQIAPAIQPILVEEKVETVLPSGTRLVGILDLVDETLTVRDAKFPTDMMKAEALMYESQPPLYAHLYHQLTGDWPTGVVFDVVSMGRGKTPNPRTATIEAPVSPLLVERAIADLGAVEASINAGIVYRRASSFNCAGCGYRKLCWGNVLPPLPAVPVTVAPPNGAASCRALVERLKLKPPVRDHLYTKHCGTTALETADPAALDDLRQELEKLAAGVRR